MSDEAKRRVALYWLDWLCSGRFMSAEQLAFGIDLWCRRYPHTWGPDSRQRGPDAGHSSWEQVQGL